MEKNIFKIYDGRNCFWQWDMGQKLIVLNKDVTEVHFSNRDMTHAIRLQVYELSDGTRVCNVPDSILQLPRNLVAYAYVSNGTETRTIKSVKFAVTPRPIPDNYIVEQNTQVAEISRRLEMVEQLIQEVEQGKQKLLKFNSMLDASTWVNQNGSPGDIIVVRVEDKWIAHIIEDNKSIVPICNCDGELVAINIVDGGDNDGYTTDELMQVWDGGGASGY